MSSQAHLLTYANKRCTSEHFPERGCLRLRLALLLGVDHCSLFTACVSACPVLAETLCVAHSHKPSPVHSHVWNARAKHSSSVGACSGQGLQPDSGLDWQKELVGVSAVGGLQWGRACLQWPHQLRPAARWNWNVLCLHWQLHLRGKLSWFLKLLNLLTGFVFFKFVVLNSGP